MIYKDINSYLTEKIKTYFELEIDFDYAVDYNDWLISYATITPGCIVIYDDYNYAENYEGYEDIPSHSIRIIVNTWRENQTPSSFMQLFKSIDGFKGIDKYYMIIDKKSKWLPTDKSKLAYEISLVIGESE